MSATQLLLSAWLSNWKTLTRRAVAEVPVAMSARAEEAVPEPFFGGDGVKEAR
jgi:hypothetical protein